MIPKKLARFAPLGISFLLWITICAVTSIAAHAQALPAESVRKDARGMARVFMPQVFTWEDEILRWSEGYGLDPNLVATVMQIESCGNPRAVSRSGAQGLFQVMPFHFLPEEEMQNPEINAQRGLAYLAESLWKAEGDIRRALAGYNGGHAVIGWEESQWPAETQRYAYWGAGIFSDAITGRMSSPRLAEWLAAGGASLCEKASKQMGD